MNISYPQIGRVRKKSGRASTTTTLNGGMAEALRVGKREREPMLSRRVTELNMQAAI